MCDAAPTAAVMRRRFLALAAALGTAPGLAAEPGQARVVVQVSDGDPARWNLALSGTTHPPAHCSSAFAKLAFQTLRAVEHRLVVDRELEP